MHTNLDEDAKSKHEALVFQIEKMRSHVEEVTGKMQSAITKLQANSLELDKSVNDRLGKQSDASESGFAAVHTNLKSLNLMLTNDFKAIDKRVSLIEAKSV